MANSRHILRSLKAKAKAQRSFTERFADWTANFFGSIPFFVIHFIWFGAWIVINTFHVPGLPQFDPYPYGLLTMTVSLEAIFLSILVLLAQNRAGDIADLREEIDLQVDILTEQELTKLMHMVSLLLEKNGISVSGDKELERMLKPTNMQKIEASLAEEINTTLNISATKHR